MRPINRPILLLGIVPLCLLTTSLLPVFFKTFFVESTGNYMPLAPPIAAALFIAFIFRKDLARKLTLIICTVLAISMIFIISVNGFSDEKNIGLLYLFMLQLVSIFILKDKQVKDFVNKDY